MDATFSRQPCRRVCESTTVSRSGGVVVNYSTFISRMIYTKCRSSLANSPIRRLSLPCCLVHRSRTPASPCTVQRARPATAVSSIQPKCGLRQLTSMTGDAKPAGAYRPPGARGTVASDAYRRDDSNPSSGASTPMFKGGKPPGRYIPGAPIPGAPAASPNDTGKSKKKNKKKADKENGNGTATPPVQEMAGVDLNASSSAPAAEDPNAKKIRNVEKKVCQLLTQSEMYHRADMTHSSRASTSSRLA